MVYYFFLTLSMNVLVSELEYLESSHEFSLAGMYFQLYKKCILKLLFGSLKHHKNFFVCTTSTPSPPPREKMKGKKVIL